MSIFKAATVSVIAALTTGLAACQSTPSGLNVDSVKPVAVSSLPGDGVTVKPVDSGWLEARFNTEIINIGLERLGYTVEDTSTGKYAATFPSLANGDLTYTSEYLLYNHEEILERAGKENLEQSSPLVSGLAQGYQIDKRTAEAYNITSIEQLQDPEIAKLFDGDGDGKADLMGCDPGWGCELIIEHHLEAYGLEDTVEHRQGEYSVLMAEAIARYQQGKPVLYYTFNWSAIPLILEIEKDVTWLEVPYTSLPGSTSGQLSEEETTVAGKNVGFAIDELAVLANNDFVAENPAAERFFEVVSVPLEDIQAESLRIEEGENTPEDVRHHAEEWVEQNQALFDSWLEEAQQAAEGTSV